MLRRLDATTNLSGHDVCIVGAGPAGIAAALACEDGGLSVLLIESGLQSEQPAVEGLSTAAVDPARHAPVEIAARRGLGGTSRWWGGRCVPYDDIDFAPRAHLPLAAWPIPHEALSSRYDRAAAFFDIGSADFGWAAPDGSVRDGAGFDTLERWTPRIDCSEVHGERLQTSDRITVLLDATVTALEFAAAEDRVEGITVANADWQLRIPVTTLVLSAGGLETTRILLVAQREKPERFGGPLGALGRYYAGHISGKIADLVLTDPASAVDHDFFRDGDTWVRRRFVLDAEIQQAKSLLNTAFWIDNPPFHKPAHQNGILSLVWFILAIPPLGRRLMSEGVRTSHIGPRPHAWGRQLLNILTHPLTTAVDAIGIVKSRLVDKPRKPGFLLRSRDGRYPLHYHAEQAPNPDSRATLGNATDPLGTPRLNIDLRYSDTDVRSVIDSHAALDAALRASGQGRLDYYAEGEALEVLALAQATDGFHQTGLTRMGDDPATSVVDTDARAHGIDNLYIASASVFPSSGQANPTFLVIALALRVADTLVAIANRASIASPPKERAST
ncbi:GMC oxidoreductase [Brevundimonas staleyi]|uniref:GMC oxidoreductase n=1 Tax=Brevundimonas staleyi TaxID=74326 RepID=A0ABW0FV86_9CAUL